MGAGLASPVPFFRWARRWLSGWRAAQHGLHKFERLD